ncbi:MAG TPA: hypothetical protein VIF84_04295 [Candidatus Limnocylindrales bacterium]
MTGRTSFGPLRLLVIDGNNLLHRTAGGLDASGRPGGPAARVLVPRLRAMVPEGCLVDLVLDGTPDPGGPMREKVGVVTIRHAGRRSADDAIVELVDGQRPADRAATVVVTDDRALADRVRRLGARHERIDWLQARLDLAHRGPRSADQSASVARSKPVGAGRPATEADPQDEDRTPWRPGRGATRKRGNPRRGRPPGKMRP